MEPQPRRLPDGDRRSSRRGHRPIVTVGRHNDPASLGPQPDDVLIHEYIHQGVLLPRCDAVITHGGSGTTLGALAFGVLLLVLPQGADQYDNAERIVTAGAGLQLLNDDLTVDAVRDAVRAVLDDAIYRRSAERIQTEIHKMPDARDAVTRIEAFTRS